MPMRRFLALLALASLLSACGDPAPEPLPEPSPDPQTAAAEPQATELRDAMQAPIDKARAVEETQAADEAERQQALDDAGG
jgi:PBP1b-binding outer membrane lipoprotein LpoB